jgi:hypothetical protein
VEASCLRKAIVYFAAAVVVGLFVVLVPLLIFGEISVENYVVNGEFLSEGFRGLEGSYGFGATRPSLSDLETLTISFTVAMVVYLLVRRKITV